MKRSGVAHSTHYSAQSSTEAKSIIAIISGGHIHCSKDNMISFVRVNSLVVSIELMTFVLPTIPIRSGGEG